MLSDNRMSVKNVNEKSLAVHKKRIDVQFRLFFGDGHLCKNDLEMLVWTHIFHM